MARASFCTTRLKEQEEEFISEQKLLKVFRAFLKAGGSVNFLCVDIKKAWIRLHVGHIMLIVVVAALLFVSLLLGHSKKRPVISRSKDGSGLTERKNRRPASASWPISTLPLEAFHHVQSIFLINQPNKTIQRLQLIQSSDEN